MTQRAHDDEPFDPERWAASVAGRTLRLTAESPVDAESDRDGPGLRPPEPVECGLCGEDVLPIGAAPGDGGHCPNCGFEPGGER